MPVATQVGEMGGGVGEQVPGDGEQGVTDGDQGALLAAAPEARKVLVRAALVAASPRMPPSHGLPLPVAAALLRPAD